MPYVCVKKEFIALYATLQNTHTQTHTYKQNPPFNLPFCFDSFVPPRQSFIYPKCLIVTCIQDFMHTLTLIIGARKNKLTWSQQNKIRRREKQGGSDNSERSERLKRSSMGILRPRHQTAHKRKEPLACVPPSHSVS